jgi:hypothetical protein
MTEVEKLRERLKVAEESEQRLLSAQRQAEVQKAVGAYKHVYYQELELDNAESKLRDILQNLDMEQWVDYVQLTTEFDKKMNERNKKKEVD